MTKLVVCLFAACGSFILWGVAYQKYGALHDKTPSRVQRFIIDIFALVTLTLISVPVCFFSVGVCYLFPVAVDELESLPALRVNDRYTQWRLQQDIEAERRRLLVKKMARESLDAGY